MTISYKYKIKMAVSWLQCVSLQSCPVFEQDESLALPINVRASQVLDPLRCLSLTDML